MVTISNCNGPLDREQLEQLALKWCPAHLFYDLLDNLEIATDQELRELIPSYLPW